LKNIPDIKFYENPYGGSRIIPCGGTDGLTDMTHPIGAFNNFANEPNNNNNNNTVNV